MTGVGVKVVNSLYLQFGGNVGWRKYKQSTSKDLLTWTITSRKEIQNFLQHVTPFLIVKKAQALAVTEFFEGGTYVQKDWKSNRMTDSEYKRREMLCEKVKLLNKKCK